MCKFTHKHNINESILGGLFTENRDGLLNLLLNVPSNIKAKIAEFSQNDEILIGKVELIVLFGDELIKVKQKVEAIGGIFENLGFGYGIITINMEDLLKVSTIEEIQYIELPKTLFTSDLGSNRAACVPEVWQLYNLTGEGVLVGFIDSGIDYLHPAFKNEAGDTRIEYIYDLSQGGKVWNKNDINRAINSPNPYSIVSQEDFIGHGTHVAGIACGGGNINKRYYGTAYKASIAMVKMTGSGKVNYAKSTQLMRGIRFLIDKSKELKQPLVISLSFSTNDGAHNGNSLLEQYMQTVCSLERISFVVAAGNEGAAAHHVGGVLRESINISMAMASDEESFILQFYKDFLSDISIEIKSPQGISSGVIALKDGRYYEGNIGTNKYFIYNSGSKPFDINGEIIVSLNVDTGYLTEGIWEINIYSTGETVGRFDIWMPIAEGLNPNTKFLKPNPFNTLGIPATVSNVISVGSYNYKTNSLSGFSGRGRLEGDKPDIMAPGEEILSSIPGGRYDSLSGTSMAAPHAAGASALFMQWGLVLGNDPYMYGDRLKYYMLKGARRERTDTVYPGSLWGYGELCVKGGMNLAIRNRVRNKESMRLKEICKEYFYSEEYSNYVVEYEGDINSVFENIDFGCVFILDERYAIVSIDADKAEEFFNNTKEIIYVEEPSLYTLNQISPIDAANISKFHENPALTLTGQGVLVGIIDTGIDYLNEEFIYENDTTRIVSIWDQTIKDTGVPEIPLVGRRYSRKEINRAIIAKKQGQDPYAIVDSKDEIGHGTSMAGIIGGRGRNPELIGAAPGCEFVVAKLENAKKNSLIREGINEGDVPTYCTAEILLGIKYIYAEARRLKKPVVIYIPLGTNKGSHDGTSIIERYIDEISKVRGVVVVTSCGNEGDGEIHVSGEFEKTGEEKIIELQVDPMQRNLKFQIWCERPDKVSIGITSPSGEVIDKIPARLGEKEVSKLIFEGSVITVEYFLPEEITGDELIKIDIRNARGGIWKFKLFGDFIVDGRYNAWLYQRELLKDGTKFLAPSQNTTLTIPSTSRKVISCAYYNQNTETIVSASGRGFTREQGIKPDIAAGGINALTVSRGGGTTRVSGSSVGAAVTAGAIALILEWGIVKGNDPTMYSTKVKTYLIRGADRRPGDVYPNRSWGFGILDINGVFEKIR
ncbi:S8 family peptidase [Clostridium ganghwense]|uniref:S8 family serine peptidase n=1 Tax=Clostridium ganghwense TaxID=312089 RepID=A0ABT4CLV1_9CLOT|nr:S8 family peptidase [Clostridium ganghwense]MCY6370024.1 S8 family serine peptidase [Clostridium ganghwense]